LTGTKWTLVPAQKQPVLIECGRIALFLVVQGLLILKPVNESGRLRDRKKLNEVERLTKNLGQPPEE